MNRAVWDYLDKRMGDSRDMRRDRRYDRRDRRDRRDYDDYDDREYDERRSYRRDYRMRDYEDGHDVPLELSKSDIYEWERKMQNADGSKGKHYDLQQVVQTAERLGINFDDFDEKELCVATNMFYSDYCEVLSRYVPKDKMLVACVELGKAFLEDEDGPAASEKLALYYHCIVGNEEV